MTDKSMVVGIGGTDRLLSTSKNTVLIRIKMIATTIKKPAIVSAGGIYEVDEI